MRFLAVPVVIFLATLSMPAAQAVPAATDGVKIAPSSGVVEVAGRCGPHQHWVPRHRNRHGKVIHGHCAANRR